MSIRESKIVLVTHFLIYSSSQALRDYLLQNKNRLLLYISHPLPLIDANRKENSLCVLYSQGLVVHSQRATRLSQGLFFSVCWHFFLTLYWGMRTKGKFDLYVGVDNLNALCGIILHWVGKVERVVYYTIDYFPTRFQNKFLNSVYHAVDKFCVKHATETWNVSGMMPLARKKYNSMDPQEFSRQYTVPIGVWFERVARKPFDPKRRFRLLFLGHLVKHMGVDLVIRSLPMIISSQKAVHLEIIGGGEELEALTRLAKYLKVECYITFHGWIRDRKKVEELISDCGIGLATFNTEILDEKVQNADPMKIKDYMLFGLPVIATRAISNWRDIERAKCGIIIDYSEDSFVRAVMSLFKNERDYRRYHNQALKFVKQYDYQKLFDKNLSRVLAREV
jgi:glycosyltransferase involved in cell wall biosynthesis